MAITVTTTKGVAQPIFSALTVATTVPAVLLATVSILGARCGRCSCCRYSTMLNARPPKCCSQGRRWNDEVHHARRCLNHAEQEHDCWLKLAPTVVPRSKTMVQAAPAEVVAVFRNHCLPPTLPQGMSDGQKYIVYIYCWRSFNNKARIII